MCTATVYYIDKQFYEENEDKINPFIYNHLFNNYDSEDVRLPIAQALIAKYDLGLFINNFTNPFNAKGELYKNGDDKYLLYKIDCFNDEPDITSGAVNVLMTNRSFLVHTFKVKELTELIDNLVSVSKANIFIIFDNAFVKSLSKKFKIEIVLNRGFYSLFASDELIKIEGEKYKLLFNGKAINNEALNSFSFIDKVEIKHNFSSIDNHTIKKLEEQLIGSSLYFIYNSKLYFLNGVMMKILLLREFKRLNLN